MASDTQRIVLISPVRNESETLQQTIDSVVAQTIRPSRWVIVDDGSEDETAEIADRAAKVHDWIRVLRRQDRGHRSVGSGVIEAFDAGLAEVDTAYDFIGKLDGDLEFGPHYLERALREFDTDSNLAAVSGKIYHWAHGQLQPEFSMINESVAGCFKLYRSDAFHRIGGFVRSVMWDGIDFHRARQAGFRTKSLPDEELRIIHLRPMGSSDRGIFRGRLRWGRGQYFMGSSPLYVFASGIFRMREKPYVIGGLLIIAGFLIAMLRQDLRYDDRAFRTDLRAWQRKRLLKLVGIT